MNRIATWLGAQTVNRKLILVILGSCGASLLVAGAALFLFMTFMLRTNFANNTHALTEVAAASCAGPVVQEDKKEAMEILAALAAQSDVCEAAIFLPDGTLLARAGDPADDSTLAPRIETGTWISKYRFQQTCTIRESDAVAGFVSLTTDFTQIHDGLFRSYVQVFTSVLLTAAVLAITLNAAARRFIGDPLRNLITSVKTAARQSPRPAKSTANASSELDELADAFTRMQERIDAGAKLEREIGERHKVEQALRKSEEQFRSLFENAPVGLYRSNREGHFTMANPALLRMLGYDTLEELSGLHVQNEICVEPGYRTHFNECVERFGLVEETEVRWRRRDGKVIFVRESAKAIRNSQGEFNYCQGCVEDITARKEAQAEVQRLHRELVAASRASGMAEVATNVLHNVGNVLNSVNVSATVLHDQMSRSKLPSLDQAVCLLEANRPSLHSYLTADEKGKLLPDFLKQVVRHMAIEQERWRAELKDMKKNIEHMKVIVSMQQHHAKATGMSEPVSAMELVEDALRMNGGSLQKHGIGIIRDFADVGPVMVDKHKVLQILINLIRNAEFALEGRADGEKQLKLTIHKNGSGRVKIQVSDNGVGISPDDLTRIFSHGFTTRRNGHGFGLHSGALAAREVGGALAAHSEGAGRGATFTLELPIAGTRN